MNDYPTLGCLLPHSLNARLFGDRRRFGVSIRPGDPDWEAWKAIRIGFYYDTQKRGLGKIVNDAGYRILRHLDLSGRRVLEVGPGSMPHVRFWRGTPAHYAIVDVDEDLLRYSAELLRARGIPAATYLSESLPEPPADRFDLIVTFYSLEHLHPLDRYLTAIERWLRPGGMLIGAVPAEGGLAWGMGRFLTTRRYIRKRSSANPDKIICWEHPNFASSVLNALDRRFECVRVEYWPLWLPLIDANLVVRFVYRRGRVHPRTDPA